MLSGGGGEVVTRDAGDVGLFTGRPLCRHSPAGDGSVTRDTHSGTCPRGRGVNSGTSRKVFKGVESRSAFGATLPDRCFFCRARTLAERLSLTFDEKNEKKPNEDKEMGLH